MDINKMCPGCMQEVEDRDNVETCPHCSCNLGQIKSEPHQMQPFTILAGKYLIGRVIGEGGFGISYIGLDLNLELVVAIKEFYPNGFVTRESNVTTMVSMYAGKNEADVSKWREGFINEARNLAKFSNLNGIVEVRDFFNENGTAYIVMEYIDGITLKQYLKQNGGKLSADQTFEMMEPVIRSMSKVHDAGMIHRDISPDNIMITKYGGMKLLDFGAAREFAGNAEKSLSIMLKPGYAPEEQYRSRGKQGPWSDVYALTATIYKCITGVTPVESMERMREDTLKPPKELGVSISDVQNAAVMQGMAVYAENRIQNMDALHTALYSDKSAVKAEPSKNMSSYLCAYLPMSMEVPAAILPHLEALRFPNIVQKKSNFDRDVFTLVVCNRISNVVIHCVLMVTVVLVEPDTRFYLWNNGGNHVTVIQEDVKRSVTQQELT